MINNRLVLIVTGTVTVLAVGVQRAVVIATVP